MFVRLTIALIASSVPLPSKCANATAPEPVERISLVEIEQINTKNSPECLTTTIMQVVASSDPTMWTFLSCGAIAAISRWLTYSKPTGPICGGNRARNLINEKGESPRVTHRLYGDGEELVSGVSVDWMLHEQRVSIQRTFLL